ncbi:MAG TPA: DNA-binding protein WhiA [Firmicutes bacterium]|nr:DNA-binding protein WhiA [Bacillota bacterium]
MSQTADSFSRRTKEELARRFPDAECCARAELAAIIHTAGSLHFQASHRLVLSVESENIFLLRKVFRLLKAFFQVRTEAYIKETERLGGRRRYSLHLRGEERVKKVLMACGIMTRRFELEGGINPSLVQNDCCRAAFLRGVLLGRGSITDPQKSDYHLELVTESEEFAHGLVYLMDLCGFRAGLSVNRRKDFYVVYLKDAEAIGRFLSFVRAYTAYLRMEEMRIIKGMREEVNRQVNCETANLEKTLRAAWKQVEILSAFAGKAGLNNLPEKLREAAFLRLENPEASLRELGKMAVPPVSKSTMNYRMRRVLKIAKNFTGEKEIFSSKGNRNNG